MIPPTVSSSSTFRAISRIILALGLAVILLSVGYVTIAAPNATISLSAEPGTSVAIKPTENEYISWIITPSNDNPPVHTEFIIYNQDGDTLYSEIYTDGNGLKEDYIYTLPATYTVPTGLPFEQYVAQIDYYSTHGQEAQASVVFFVSQDTGALHIIKFNDLNLNGVEDPDEPRVEGVIFRVQFPAPFTDTIFTDQTDSNGEILYPQLGTGAYTVTEVTPLGTIPTNDDIRIVRVEKDMTATASFGNAAIPGGIEVFKFHDHNGNGVRDAEDGPLKGVSFNASAPCGQSASGASGDDGYVRWPRLCIGEWTVTETIPSNFRATTPPVVTTTVGSGVTSTLLFGNQGLGELIAFKFEDKNGNGVQDPGEPAWSGVAVAYENEYGDTDSCTTDASGLCTFSDVPEGAYTVTETLPPNSFPVSGDTVTATLETGQTTTATFANRKLGFLEIIKFEDINGNGVQDQNEPAWSDIDVAYINDYGETDACTTDADGKCFFSNVAKGVYTVTETLPPFSEAVVSETFTTTVTYSGLGLVVFPNRRLGDLQIIKFEDMNGNGVRDSGEPVWSGVAVTYTNSYGDTDSCTTDANGECLFTRLPVGVYTITEELPHDSIAVVGPVITTTLEYAITRTATFANRRLGALLPHVFWDINGDGTQDPGEPDQAGFSVSYLNDYGETGIGQTDSNGAIIWSLLPIGGYTTTLALANGCSATTANPSTDDVPYAQTTYLDFGYRCMLYLPLVIKDWPPPTPTPTATPTPTDTPTPTNTPTPTITPTPTATPTATPTPPSPLIPVVHPKTIAINSDTNTLYVSSITDDSLYVINGGDNTVTTQLAVGQAPYGVDVNPVTQKAYVANVDSNTISVIDLTTNAVIATIPLDPDSKPLQVAVNPDTNKVYVTLHGLNQLAVIDGATDTVIKIISNLPGAFDVIVNRPDNQVYVSARDAHFVSVINGATDEEVTQITPGGETYAMAFDPTLKQLYTLIAPDGPLYLMDNPVGDIYLPLPNINEQEEPNPNVIIIFEVKPNYDFGRRSYRVAGEAGPQGGIGIAANPTTGNFFVSNAADNTLTVFDGVSLVTHATLPMDGDPGDVAVNPANNRIYVSNRSADIVHMIIDNW